MRPRPGSRPAAGRGGRPIHSLGHSTRGYDGDVDNGYRPDPLRWSLIPSEQNMKTNRARPRGEVPPGPVDLIEDEAGWSPSSLEDATKLDDVRTRLPSRRYCRQRPNSAQVYELLAALGVARDALLPSRFAPRGDHDAIETGTDFAPKFDADGLIVAIAVDAATGEVLMVAHMNEEALARTIETGSAWFWSRSRQKLWRKGEESGNTLAVREMRVDCDQDAILLKVEIAGDAVACHRATARASTARYRSAASRTRTSSSASTARCRASGRGRKIKVSRSPDDAPAATCPMVRAGRRRPRATGGIGSASHVRQCRFPPARTRSRPPPEPKPQTRRATLGIALGGGAARGWAHIGVFRALDRGRHRPGHHHRHVDRRRGRRLLRGGRTRQPRSLRPRA